MFSFFFLLMLFSFFSFIAKLNKMLDFIILRIYVHYLLYFFTMHK